VISLVDLFRISILSLFESKLRAILSLLGIAIGIAAVFMIFTLSQGGKRVIFSELESLGLNSFYVSRDYSVTSTDDSFETGINQSDLDKLFEKYKKETLIISPVVSDDFLSIYQLSGKKIYAKLNGVNESFLSSEKQILAAGRKLSYFDLLHKNKVIVITESIAKEMKLTPRTALKKTLMIAEINYQIIGVLRDKKLNFLSSIGSVNQKGINNTIYLPFNVLLKAQGSEQISYLYGELINKDKIKQVANNMTKYLTLLHQSKFIYTFSSMDGYITVANNILKNVSFLGGVSSLAALFVGGIGVMNMMSTSVVERTAEIGLRKALGASNKDIKKQIIIESLLITIIGSMLGVFIGVILSVIVSLLVDAPFRISPLAIFASITITLLVGILSGYIPANKAASITPVEALNHE